MWLTVARGLETPVQVDRAGSAEIERLRARDPQTWSLLFEREVAAIYRYALSGLGRPEDAEDVTSAVFAAAWEGADRLRDHGLPARAWLFGIARNIIGTHRRWLLRRPPVLALEAFDQPESDRGLSPELLDLAQALQRLNRGQAEVVSLRFIHGLSLEETASVLETSVEGVKGRQARALAALRETLDR
ncbi:MAG: sigma-70 family RNA polymerase sigma factor [Dehalococcoidia bacterium]|nr:sigma-70 family RNA polymerase sigma factor [Dehalococcoidia bacterium]